MKIDSHRRRTGLALAAAAAIALGLLAQPAGAGAQPTRGKTAKPKAEKTEKTDTMQRKAAQLTDEQREQVQQIMKEHREQSRQELREKLSEVLTPEQLERFDARADRYERFDGRGGGMRGDFGLRHNRHNRRDFRHWSRRGGRGDCRCDRGDFGRGGGRWDGPGPRMGMGPGPRMGMGMGPGPGMDRGGFPGMRGGFPGMDGEFRGERGDRMVGHLTTMLDLTADQQEKVADIVRTHHEQFKDFDPSTLSFDERQKTREAHHALLVNRIKEVLTPEQAEKLDAMKDRMPGPPHGHRGMRG